MAKRDYYLSIKILKRHNLIAGCFAQDLMWGKQNTRMGI